MGILGIRMARNAGPLDLKEFDQHLTRILGLAAGSTLVSCKGIACHFPGGEGLVMWIIMNHLSCIDLHRCYPTQKKRGFEVSQWMMPLATNQMIFTFEMIQRSSFVIHWPIRVHPLHTSEHTQNHIDMALYPIKHPQSIRKWLVYLVNFWMG